MRHTGFDACLANLGGGRLTRSASVTYLETSREIGEATYQLALAGIRAAPRVTIPGLTTSQRPAIALDLVPLDGAFPAIDVVEVRWIPLSDASAALMRRRLPWLRSARPARDACRRLLREEDAVLAWRRIVWCSVASMREARSRVRIRPVVFDRAAVERHPLRWTYVSDGAIERWAFM
ncbi:MAG: hypothetical protein ACRDF9_14365 [Candidatus Limnocylindria bacterium]